MEIRHLPIPWPVPPTQDPAGQGRRPAQAENDFSLPAQEGQRQRPPAALVEHVRHGELLERESAERAIDDYRDDYRHLLRAARSAPSARMPDTAPADDNASHPRARQALQAYRAHAGGAAPQPPLLDEKV